MQYSAHKRGKVWHTWLWSHVASGLAKRACLDSWLARSASASTCCMLAALLACLGGVDGSRTSAADTSDSREERLQHHTYI